MREYVGERTFKGPSRGRDVFRDGEEEKRKGRGRGGERREGGKIFFINVTVAY